MQGKLSHPKALGHSKLRNWWLTERQCFRHVSKLHEPCHSLRWKMRHIWLGLPLVVLVGCLGNPGPTVPIHATVVMASCQPYGYSPAPIEFSFTPGPVTSSSAEQTAVALFRACGATPSTISEPTVTITELTSSSKAASGMPSGPNAG